MVNSRRRNMLLYVTATSMVGLACESSHAVGDVAQNPDTNGGKVGKIAMVEDAAVAPPPMPIGSAASSPDLPVPMTDAGAKADAGGDAGATKSTTPVRPHPPGKVARPDF